VGVPQGQQQQQNQRNAPPPTATDVLNVDPGKSVNVPVAVERRGYDGPIELAAEGLPEGVTAQPATVPAKQAAGQITIQAAAGSSAPLSKVRIIGTAKIDDQEVKRVLRNEIVMASLDPIHVARRELAEFALAVPDRQPPLAIKTEEKAVLARGMEMELKVAVKRSAELKGPLTLNVQKLPQGVTANKATIEEGKSEGTIKLTSKGNAALGNNKIQLVAQGKSGNTSVDASAEVSLSVIMPFEITLDAKDMELALTVGENQTLKVSVKRQGEFDAPIELTVTGLPAGVTAAPVKVEPGQEDIELTFTVADNAKPVKNPKQVKMQAASSIRQEKIKVESQPIAVTIKPAE
ncbi:MAG: hypothetical protein HY000_28155, partial [Planctomycetes bacterium]|nr:hypothetical protein [Planctomycetota bacterium]